MNPFDAIKKLLLKYSYLGVETPQCSNAILIGKAPFLGEEGWLNRIYHPITDKEIGEIEEILCRTMPSSYAQFLTKYSNGLNVLGDTLCLFGYRFDYVRDNNITWQPYSIIDLNKFDKPRNSTDNMFFIGEYEWDGSFLYMTPDQRVHFCTSTDSQSLVSWDSIFSMLISETERLYALFDSKGIQIDEEKPTTPQKILIQPVGGIKSVRT